MRTIAAARGAINALAAEVALSRRFAAHRAFALGTGKIHALAGYTSAVNSAWSRC